MQRLALCLWPWRRLLLFAAVLSLLLLSSSLAWGYPTSEWTIPALLGLLWFLHLYGLAHGFAGLPAPPAPGSGLFARLRRRLLRGLYWLLAIMTLLISLAVVFTSLRLLLI